jgi:predicted PurR-regulated permease PerM
MIAKGGPGPDDLMNEDRVELLITAVIGALLGIITGIVLGYGPAYTAIWALIGAVLFGELVYWLRRLLRRKGR